MSEQPTKFGPDSVEDAFRRGYQQGSYDTLHSVQRHPTEKVRDWVDRTLADWRISNLDRQVLPPRLP
jgi:hypothetical protein